MPWGLMDTHLTSPGTISSAMCHASSFSRTNLAHRFVSGEKMPPNMVFSFSNSPNDVLLHSGADNDIDPAGGTLSRVKLVTISFLREESAGGKYLPSEATRRAICRGDREILRTTFGPRPGVKKGSKSQQFQGQVRSPEAVPSELLTCPRGKYPLSRGALPREPIRGIAPMLIRNNKIGDGMHGTSSAESLCIWEHRGWARC